MNEIDWYFPESLEEASKLLHKAQPHGGGTSILKGSMNRIHGLIDLSRLPLDYFKNDGGIIRIGATQTFAEIITNFRKRDPEHILIKALPESASKSLRNRITVGGSVAAFPTWSDIMGPLLALEAHVTLIGTTEGTYPLSQFVENHDLKKGTLITEVSFREDEWFSGYYKERRTYFDYALFTLTILHKITEGRIDDIRIVIIGTKKRYMRLDALEKFLRDKAVNEVNIEEAVRKVELHFHRKQALSPDYIDHLAMVQLERGLTEVVRR